MRGENPGIIPFFVSYFLFSCFFWQNLQMANIKRQTNTKFKKFKYQTVSQPFMSDLRHPA
jgi:hypothetical protein